MQRPRIEKPAGTSGTMPSAMDALKAAVLALEAERMGQMEVLTSRGAEIAILNANKEDAERRYKVEILRLEQALSRSLDTVGVLQEGLAQAKLSKREMAEAMATRWVEVEEEMSRLKAEAVQAARNLAEMEKEAERMKQEVAAVKHGNSALLRAAKLDMHKLRETREELEKWKRHAEDLNNICSAMNTRIAKSAVERDPPIVDL